MKISEKQYLDALRSLYTRYFKDRKEYLDEYKKYESEYLTGMLNLHNKALSGISTLFSHKIDSANDAKDEIIDALNEEKDAADETYQKQIDDIDELISKKNKRIDAIQAEIDKIKEIAEARKLDLELQQAEYNLARMQAQKTKQVYKDGQLVWDVDYSGIRDAKEKVTELQEEKKIAELEKQIDLIQKQIDLLEEQKNSIQKMMDESDKYYDNLIKEQEKYWDSMIKGMEDNKSRWEELADIQEIAEAFSAVQQVFGDLGYSVQDVLDGSDAAFEDFKSKYISLISDVNSNSDFTDGLVYATGVAKENLGSFLDKTQETADGLDTLGEKADGLNSIADVMDKASVSATALGSSTENVNKNISGISDSLYDIPEADKFNNLATAFTALSEAIQSVSDTLNQMTLGTNEDDIISQFSNLKSAVENVTSAISGSVNSNMENKGDSSNSSSASMSYGTGGDSGGLSGAIDQIKQKTNEALGSDGENEGAIGQFNQLKTAVDEVTTAIDSEDNDSAEVNLTGSINELGTTTKETLGESGGDGVIGKFEEFENVINEADEHVHGISNGLNEIDGKEVECTIKVNVETNGNIPAHAEGTLGNMNLESGEYTARYGKAFAEGTGEYKGLPHAEKNALVSEYGQTEMTVLPDGKTIITDTPTMMDLPKDTVIYNEEETKKIMDNKVDVSGNAHADGTDDSIWTTLADGTKVRPLQPGDKMYDLQQKFEAYFKSIDGNVEKLVPNSYYEQNRELSKLADQISYANSITNNRNVQQPVINVGDVNVTCPGVTSQEVMREVGNALGKQIGHLALRAIQEPLHDY